MDRGGEGTFRLFGYAGSGKTTLAKEFASGLGGMVLYGAFTGKAASVLQAKGCMGATTIHRLAYKPADKNKDELKRLKEQLESIEKHLASLGQTAEQYPQDSEWFRVHGLLQAEVAVHKRPNFMLNEESAIKDCTMLIVDECSMVDERMGRDLESFNRPILVLGDPAQLPPVKGAGYFTDRKPDVLLTEIHRQAKDNPILRMATDVREGRGLSLGNYGDSKVITKADIDVPELLSYDQLLVGTNAWRHAMNARVRHLRGRKTLLPEGGDRLVCLRNNHELGLLNGGLWNVLDEQAMDEHTVELHLKSEDGPLEQWVTGHTAYFKGSAPPFWDIKEKECFDYGYALTTHKAQGSQWDKVYVFDESKIFKHDARKWLYTALTRAAKQVVVVKE